MKCGRCGKNKSLRRLRREIRILQGFYQLQPAYRLSQDLGLDVKVVTRIYHRLREALYHVTELEAGKLKGEIELDEAISYLFDMSLLRLLLDGHLNVS